MHIYLISLVTFS